MYYKYEFGLGNCNQKFKYKSLWKTFSNRLRPSHSKAAQEALEACGIAQGPELPQSHSTVRHTQAVLNMIHLPDCPNISWVTI